MDAGRVILMVCVVLFTAAAAVSDVRVGKLPNKLTVSAFAAALLFHLINGAVTGGWQGAGSGVLFSLAGFSVGFGILLVLWLIGSGGGGDVKFMGALGAWLGPQLTVAVFLLSAVLVLFSGVAVLAWRFIQLGYGGTQRRYMSSADDSPAPRSEEKRGQAEQNRRVRRRLLAFGVPGAVATWIVLAAELSHLLLGGPPGG
jgi:prepilin peptidase CpaA